MQLLIALCLPLYLIRRILRPWTRMNELNLLIALNLLLEFFNFFFLFPDLEVEVLNLLLVEHQLFIFQRILLGELLNYFLLLLVDLGLIFFIKNRVLQGLISINVTELLNLKKLHGPASSDRGMPKQRSRLWLDHL